MDRPVPHDWSTGPLTFVPGSPPRRALLARWRPDAGVGLFADPSGSGSVEVVVSFDGESPRPVTMAADLVPVAAVLDDLVACGGASSASPSARLWSAAATLALDLVARGHLVPAVTAEGWDAWRVDPLEPADHALLDELAAACPPEAHALVGPERATVVDPAWAIRSFLDAVADSLVRTAAAPSAAGSHVFAGSEPVPAAPFRPWVASAYGHVTAGVRLGLRVELPDADPEPALEPESASDDVLDLIDAVLGEQRGDVLDEPLAEVVVQARSGRDPSLIVDAAALDALPLAARSRLGVSASSDLVLAVARAARRWTPLDRVLDAPRIDRVRLDPGELDGLIEATPALEAAGVEVLWPAAALADLRPRLVATAPPTAGNGAPVVGLDSLLDFRWEVLCDGTPLSAEELDAVADAKRGLVRLRGRWVRVDPERLRRLRRLPDGLEGPGGLAATLAGEVVDADGQVIEVVADDVVEVLRHRLGELAGIREEPEPPGLAATLRPYQRRGVAWMADLCAAGLGGVLADDMGLGKTIQVIALHLVRTRDDAATSPMLVVCPTSLSGNWARELARFAPGVPVRRLAGDRRLDALAPDEVVIVTYGVMRRRAEELAEIGWGVVVADEAQHIKNPRSRTARALRTIPARARLALTGTPVENRLSELWALLDWTVPGLLGNSDHFRREFAVPIERRGAREPVVRLGVLTRPFMLRRRKTDPAIAADLPSRTHHDVVVPLSAEQLTLYEALVRSSLEQIRGTEGADRTGMVFRLLTGLKQIANHPAQYLHETDGPLAGRSGKLDAAVELVGAAVEGEERVLVFSQYVTMCHLLRRRLAEAGVEAEVLHGGLSAAARDRLVERFQAGEVPVMVISLKAGGTGLNLTAATQVVHFDRWWNPAVEDQATDRAWRIGQTRPVVVHRLVSEGTIDERIAEMIERKRALADSVVGGGETWIAELDDAALAELVRLRSGATTLREGMLV